MSRDGERKEGRNFMSTWRSGRSNEERDGMEAWKKHGLARTECDAPPLRSGQKDSESPFPPSACGRGGPKNSPDRGATHSRRNSLRKRFALPSFPMLRPEWGHERPSQCGPNSPGRSDSISLGWAPLESPPRAARVSRLGLDLGYQADMAWFESQRSRILNPQGILAEGRSLPRFGARARAFQQSISKVEGA